MHAAQRLRRVRVAGLAPGTPLAFDGEITEAPAALWIDKDDEALTVYRPLPL